MMTASFQIVASYIFQSNVNEDTLKFRCRKYVGNLTNFINDIISVVTKIKCQYSKLLLALKNSYAFLLITMFASCIWNFRSYDPNASISPYSWKKSALKSPVTGPRRCVSSHNSSRWNTQYPYALEWNPARSRRRDSGQQIWSEDIKDVMRKEEYLVTD